jgi:hypothetical protein
MSRRKIFALAAAPRQGMNPFKNLSVSVQQPCYQISANCVSPNALTTKKTSFFHLPVIFQRVG